MSGGGGKIEQRVVLTREETARWLHALANALEAGGTADVALVGPTVALNLPEEFECELELKRERGRSCRSYAAAVPATVSGECAVRPREGRHWA